MGQFLKGINDFIARNVWILYIILIGTVLLTVVLHFAALLHTWRGTKNPFTICMCICVIVDCLLYVLYLYYYIAEGRV